MQIGVVHFASVYRFAVEFRLEFHRGEALGECGFVFVYIVLRVFVAFLCLAAFIGSGGGFLRVALCLGCLVALGAGEEVIAAG